MRPWQACTGYEVTDNISLKYEKRGRHSQVFQWPSDISSERRFIDGHSLLHTGYLILVPGFTLTNSDGSDEDTAARAAITPM